MDGFDASSIFEESYWTASAVDRRWACDALAVLSDDADECREAGRILHSFPLPPRWGISLVLKDESRSPTGSLKHRVARALFAYGIRTGLIRRDTTVLEAGGGNMVVALAHFARSLDLPYIAVMPRKSTVAKVARVERAGGVPQLVHPPLAIYAEAERLATETGGYYFDHYANADRACDAARDGDGVAVSLFTRLAEESPEPVAWVVVGAGSGATSAAIGRHIRAHGLPTRLAVVDPEHSAYFPSWATGAPDYATGMPSRIEGIGRPRVEPSFVPSVVDLVIPVPDAASIAAMRLLHEATGLHAGGSTGAALWGAFRIISGMRATGAQGRVATLVFDDGEAYASTYYDDEWLAKKGFLLEPHLVALRRFLATGTLGKP